MTGFLQGIKDGLVSLGPDSPFVRAALRLRARSKGCRIDFNENQISLYKASKKLVLAKSHYVQVPITIDWFDMLFGTVCAEALSDLEVLDFSRPALHRYIKTGIAFYFPSIPEEDAMDAYTFAYTPASGDVVWDVGAYAGATTFFFAQMVGPRGKVYAFEPDEVNYAFLLKNLELHNLTNVVPVNKALAGSTGLAEFNSDGTMAAGLSEYLVYSDRRLFKSVSTVTVPNACAEFGSVPKYIKMDIEGAETAVIAGAQSFIRENSIHFAIESNHRINGELTSKALERLFPTLGYRVQSSERFGQRFTWADQIGARDNADIALPPPHVIDTR